MAEFEHRLAVADSQRADDVGGERLDTGDVGRRGDGLCLEPQFLDLGAAPGPAGDDGGAAGVGAGAGEQPGQRDGGGKQHQRDHKQERDASRAPALDADRAGCVGQQAHELGG